MKPTPAPWSLSTRTDHFNDRMWFIRPPENILTDGDLATIHLTMDTGRPEDEHAANASLILNASNSYQKHFSDPVAAAEGDLLGEALKLLRAYAVCKPRFIPNWLQVETGDLLSKALSP